MRLHLNRTARLTILLSAALIGVLGAFLLPPLAQPLEYHGFADSRGAFRIPNLLNVVSNVCFLLVGISGIVLALKTQGRRACFTEPLEKWAYLLFFLGIVLTGIGSSYYHWSPKDSTLVWDRLPMTVAFMSMLAAVLSERIAVKTGARLLIPLVIAGCGSVFYWQYSGNLWPYAFVQYYSIFLVFLIICFFPSRYTRGAGLIWVGVIYGLAKLAETFDTQIFTSTKIISGHTLKHLVAALAVCKVVQMLMKRVPDLKGGADMHSGAESFLALHCLHQSKG